MRAPVALVLCLTFALGCGGSALSGRRATPPAANGVRELISALRADDPKRAYGMLSDDVRAKLSFDDFALMWNDSKAERAMQARALEEGLRGDPDLGERSRVVFRDGRSVGLTREQGVWRLESALMSGSHASRPHDAVRLLAEALSARDYERVLRVLTGRRRDAIRNQVDRFTGSLVDHIDGAIHFVGKDGAEMRWDDGDTRYRITLKKEGDEWRVDDIHITPAPPRPESRVHTPQR